MVLNRQLHIAWLTGTPSGDQVDFLRALACRPEVDLSVLYCAGASAKGEISFREPLDRGTLLQGLGIPIPGGKVFINPGIALHLLAKRYGLVVIGGYIHPTMQLAMILLSLQRRPWVLFAERPGVNRNGIGAQIFRAVPLFMLQRAHAIIATGSMTQSAYRALCGSRPSIYSLPYLVCLEPFFKLQRDVVGQCDPVRFLFCGQLIPRKGVDILITAFVMLAQSHQKIVLTIVGDGPEKTNLLRMVPNQLKDRIIFAGTVSFETRTSAFKQADVLIHPARHDGWGVVIQEAMAAGLPVIGTRQSGAVVDLVEDGRNGFLIEAGDVDALYQRMKWFADHAEEIFAFGCRARSNVSRYTPEWGAETFVQIAEKVLIGRGLQNN